MATNLRKYTTQEVLNKVYEDSSGNTIGINAATAKETLNAALDEANSRLNVSLAGGTISGDVTISGDLTVSGGGSYAYSEVLTGDMSITNTATTVGLTITQSGVAAGLYIDHNANHNAISIDAEGTSADSVYIETDVLTTGSAIKVASGGTALASTATGGLVEIKHTGDSDTNVNNLLYIHNDHASATGTTGLKIQQDSTGPALVAMGNVGIGIAAPTGILHVEDSGANSGVCFKVSRDIAYGGTNNALVSFLNDNINDDQALFKIQQDGYGDTIDLDINNALTTAFASAGINMDFDKSGVVADGITAEVHGFDLDIDDSATNHANATVTMTGGRINVASANAQGTLKNVGLDVTVSGADTNYAALFNGGNVGIGTASPDSGHSLTLKVASTGDDFILCQQSDGGQAFRLGLDSGDDGFLEIGSAGTSDVILLQADGTSHFNGGNVGIGDSVPLSVLHVQGSSSGVVQLFINNINGGTNSSSDLVFGTWSGAIPTGAGNPGPGAKISAINTDSGTANTDLVFSTYGSATLGEYMRITSAGNVGIGITPLATFHAKMASNVDFTLSANSGDLRINAVNDAIDTAIGLEFNAADFEFVGTGATVFGGNVLISDGGGIVIGHTAQRTQVHMDIEGGTVGNSTPEVLVEGTGTDDSHVAIIRNSADDEGPQLTLGSTRNASLGGKTIVQSGDRLGTIAFSGNDGDEMVMGAGIWAVSSGTPGDADMPSDLFIGTAKDGEYQLTAGITLDKTQNVGIGTTAPNVRLGQKLDISTSANYGGMSLNSFSTTDGHAPTIDFNKSGNATIGSHTIVADDEGLGNIFFRGSDGDSYENAAAIRAFVDGTPTAGTDMPGRLEFHTSADGSATAIARMIIDGNSRISLSNNDLGTSSTIFGKDAGKGIVSNALENTFIGHFVSDATMTDAADYNTGVGAHALTSLTAGAKNTGIGAYALSLNNTGSFNVAIGVDTGNVITDGTYNTIIGQNSDPSASGGVNQTVIGATTTGVADNSVTLGNDDVTKLYAASDGGAVISAGGLGLALGTTAPNHLLTNDSTDLTSVVSGSGIYWKLDQDYRLVALFENTGTSYGYGIGIKVALSTPASGTDFIRFMDGDNGADGEITADGSGGVLYNVASDKRLKQNIGTISDALGIIKLMKPRTYNMRQKPDIELTGFIAQELYDVFPEAVTKGDDGVLDGEENIEKTWSLDKSKLTPILTKAIQELSAKNDELEARILTLESA